MKKRKIITALLCGLILLTGCGTNAEYKPVETAGEQNEKKQEANGQDISMESKSSEGKMIEAVYLEAVAEGRDSESFVMGDEHWNWWQNYREMVNASVERQEGMDAYYASVLQELLLTDQNENTVCSPLNIYIALSMLAEVTDANTRTQILDTLHADDIDMLRERSKALWEANYLDTPVIKSLLADSLWLRNDITYHKDTLQRLADDYYASSFSGEMGSEEMNRLLQEWTDQNTGGLLSEYTKDMTLDARTVLGLVSTIYYKAAWNERFQADRTGDSVFHGVSGDIKVPMMHRDDMMPLYRTDKFEAVGLGLSDSGSMYFFLPEEGVDVKAVATDPDALSICRGTWEHESSYPIVHLSIPKFRVSKKTELLESLGKLGITDALDPDKADFSPLTDKVDQIWLNAAEHAAMVEIDEEGVTGAAYTELVMAGAGMPQEEVDFVLDRPFYFAVVSPDGSLLFSGIVQTITNATEADATDRIPSIMIDGVLYQDTGYVSSAIGCGTMDGEITSSVEGSELPAENNQSNFGAGYSWQRSSEGQIIVAIDARNEIFRDPNHDFAFDMPEEVLNFRAEVKELRGNGQLLVEYIDAPEMFMKPIESVCVIPIDNLQNEVQVGDTVRVWFDGLVQEIFPPILPNVYRIVKEEVEPVERDN